jgi:hypothetical protein
MPGDSQRRTVIAHATYGQSGVKGLRFAPKWRFVVSIPVTCLQPTCHFWHVQREREERAAKKRVGTHVFAGS